MMHDPQAAEEPVLASAGAARGAGRAVDWAALAVFGIALLVFLRSIPCAFVMWDDDIEIYGNPHIRELSWSSLVWMFTDITLVRRYIPLDWLSWAVNFQLSALLTGDGLKPWTYHLGNVLIHALNAVMVYHVLRRVVGRVAESGGARVAALASCFGALLWALHPLRVEAVTWANGRIHEQALFFGLASLCCYFRAHDPWRRAAGGWFIGSVVLYFLSLLSYGTTLAYPVVLVVVDVLVLGRLDVEGRVRWCGAPLRRVLLEKIPMVLAAAAYLGINLWAGARAQGIWSKPVTLADFGVGERMMQAFYIWGRYVWKPLDLWHLTPVYTVLVRFSAGDGIFVGSMILVLGITFALWLLRRRAGGLLGVWICHLAILVPMLGLTEHPHYPSDRYAYVQGILWSVVAAVVMARLGQSAVKNTRVLAAGVGGVLLLGCAVAAVGQQAVWTNSESLFRHMLAELGEDPYQADIHWRLGRALLEEGRPAEALAETDTTLARVPVHPLALEVRFQSLVRLGDEAAKTHAAPETAARYYLGAAATIEKLGILYTRANQLSEAEGAFREGIRLAPGKGALYLGLAQVRFLRGAEPEARGLVRKSVELDPALQESADRVLAYWNSQPSTRGASATSTH